MHKVSKTFIYSKLTIILLNCVSNYLISVGLTIYIRYRQLLLLCERFQSFNDRAKGHIIISYYIGLGSCLGISLVGNFQETNVRVVHYIGAFLCFGLGTIYFWFQVRILFPVQIWGFLKSVFCIFRFRPGCRTSFSLTSTCPNGLFT